MQLRHMSRSVHLLKEEAYTVVDWPNRSQLLDSDV